VGEMVKVVVIKSINIINQIALNRRSGSASAGETAEHSTEQIKKASNAVRDSSSQPKPHSVPFFCFFLSPFSKFNFVFVFVFVMVKFGWAFPLSFAKWRIYKDLIAPCPINFFPISLVPRNSVPTYIFRLSLPNELGS